MCEATNFETDATSSAEMTLVRRAKVLAKRIFFPGLDLHTRCRYKFLPKLFLEGDVHTLDAGCGNGALSYAAYLKGSSVLGVTYLKREVEETTQLFDSMGISRERIELAQLDLYQLGSLERTFDQVICSETLEHIKRQEEVLESFAALLNPGGKLLLCCPYAEHPENALGRVDVPEDGGHVRDGYTLESYRSILEPAGFRIIAHLGLGSPLLCRLDALLRKVRSILGDGLSLPLFLLLLPLTMLDYVNPEVPLSLAVLAERR